MTADRHIYRNRKNGSIELCGAFGEAGAKAIIEVTDNQIPIGYITHLPEQDEVYAKAFGK